MSDKEIEKVFKELYHEALDETIDFDIDSHQDYVDLFIPFAKGYTCASSKLKAENERLKKDVNLLTRSLRKLYVDVANGEHLDDEWVKDTIRQVPRDYIISALNNKIRKLEGEK